MLVQEKLLKMMPTEYILADLFNTNLNILGIATVGTLDVTSDATIDGLADGHKSLVVGTGQFNSVLVLQSCVGTITITGGDLYVGGDLYISDDIILTPT